MKKVELPKAPESKLTKFLFAGLDPETEQWAVYSKELPSYAAFIKELEKLNKEDPKIGYFTYRCHFSNEWLVEPAGMNN